MNLGKEARHKLADAMMDSLKGTLGLDCEERSHKLENCILKTAAFLKSD
jgi:hypothetical protein